jgi:hypothetical protein
MSFAFSDRSYSTEVHHEPTHAQSAKKSSPHVHQTHRSSDRR